MAHLTLEEGKFNFAMAGRKPAAALMEEEEEEKEEDEAKKEGLEMRALSYS